MYSAEASCFQGKPHAWDDVFNRSHLSEKTTPSVYGYFWKSVLLPLQHLESHIRSHKHIPGLVGASL